MANMGVTDTPETASPSPHPGSAEPSALAVAGVSKNFGATTALVECSFELRRGEVHAIVGENGSGKSTLVKILSGVHRPDSGTLHIGSEPVTGLASPAVAHRHGIATVFQAGLAIAARSV